MAKKNCGCGQDPCVTFGAETFDAPYAGSGSLFSVGSSDALSGLSSKELTESSAIHGDFDSASLNYSGHQNLQVRAEESGMTELEQLGENGFQYSATYIYPANDGEEGRENLLSIERGESRDGGFFYRVGEYSYRGSPETSTHGQYAGRWLVDKSEQKLDWEDIGDSSKLYEGHYATWDDVINDRPLSEEELESFESMSWYDPGEDTNNLERAFRREYPRYTLDSSSMEYLIYQGGASNKFHIFFVAVDDGGMYHAFNAYGRIGYNPRIQYIGGPYSTFDSAEYAFKKKMSQKTKKGYRPFGAEGSGSISAYTTIPYSWETDPDPHEHDENIDNYDIENAIEYEVDSEVRSGNRSGSGTYTTTIGYDDPEDEGSWVQEDLDVDYSWGAENKDIPQVELHNPIETGIKLSLGSMIAVVGISALGGAVLGLLSRTIGDE